MFLAPGNVNQLPLLFTKAENKPQPDKRHQLFYPLVAISPSECNHYLVVFGSTETLLPLAMILQDGCLTHADGVGGVQLAAVRALAVEGAGHVAAHSVDARVGEALVDV